MTLTYALRFISKPVAAVAASMLLLNVSAQPIPGTGTFCGSYSIAHINGVLTDQASAEDSLRALRHAYGNWYNNSPVNYLLIYNPTGGLPSDLPEVLRQKATEFPGVGIVQMISYLLSMLPGSLPSTLVNDLAVYWAGWVNSNGRTYNTYNDALLPPMIDMIRASANSGGRVLLVPHSQGNLYANRIVEIITTQAAPGWSAPIPVGAVGIMGVASPAAYIAGRNKMYVTSSNDVVINSLRNGVPPEVPPSVVMSSNVTIEPTLADASGHGFREIYLGTDSGVSSVIGGVHAVLGMLLSRAQNNGDEPYALYDATVLVATPERPVFIPDEGWLTYTSYSYRDEANTAYRRMGGLAEAAAAIQSVASNCVARELAAKKRGDSFGICPPDDWRIYLKYVVSRDEIVFFQDPEMYGTLGFADVTVVGYCRTE